MTTWGADQKAHVTRSKREQKPFECCCHSSVAGFCIRRQKCRPCHCRFVFEVYERWQLVGGVSEEGPRRLCRDLLISRVGMAILRVGKLCL